MSFYEYNSNTTSVYQCISISPPRTTMPLLIPKLGCVNHFSCCDAFCVFVATLPCIFKCHRREIMRETLSFCLTSLSTISSNYMSGFVTCQDGMIIPNFLYPGQETRSKYLYGILISLHIFSLSMFCISCYEFEF